MAEVSGISWTDSTFNPWIGCARVSPACDGCYAAALMGMDGRHKRAAWGGPGEGAGTRVRTKTWGDPRRWDRAKAREWEDHRSYLKQLAATEFHLGEQPDPPAPPAPHFVFCASLADVFDNEVPLEWRQDLFALIRETPNLTWLLLTKRPQMIERLWFKSDGSNPWPINAAIGTTVEDRKRLVNLTNLQAARRGIMALGGTAPAFLFASFEPLLEDLGDLSPWLSGPDAIDWGITGGETTQGTHKARPQHPDWFRGPRDQFEAAGKAYHHKQNGEWVEYLGAHPQGGMICFEDGFRMYHAGKNAAGRLLDGVEHNARPEVAHG